MDLLTAVAILASQCQETMDDINSITSLSYRIQDLAKQENPIPAVNPQIKAIISSMDVDMTALNSQLILLQQAIDQVASIVS